MFNNCSLNIEHAQHVIQYVPYKGRSSLLVGPTNQQPQSVHMHSIIIIIIIM